jgi:hypothetical protein
MSRVATGMRRNMKGIAAYGEVYLALFAVFTVLVVVGVCFITSLGHVFSEPTGRTQRAWTSLKRSLKLVAWVVLVMAGLKYAIDARGRSNASGCAKQFSSADGGLYLTEHCFLSGDKTLLRVYRAKDGTLLAERTYPELDTPELVWSKDEVYDRFGPEDVAIPLPPSLLDRLRAKLP